MSKGQKKQQQQEKHQDAAVPQEASPLLGKELRIVLNDDRIITGVLSNFQGNGDMILLNATEFREFPAEGTLEAETAMKQSLMIAIPFKYVKGMHIRQAGHTSVSETIAARQEELYQAAVKAQQQQQQVKQN